MTRQTAKALQDLMLAQDDKESAIEAAIKMDRGIECLLGLEPERGYDLATELEPRSYNTKETCARLHQGQRPSRWRVLSEHASERATDFLFVRPGSIGELTIYGRQATTLSLSPGLKAHLFTKQSGS